MPKRIELHDEARAEFLDAVRWYADRSPAAADRFRRAVEAALARLGDGIVTGNAYLSATRYVQLHRFPYLIVYRETLDTLQIIAVAHARRRPGYWRRRLRS